MDNRHTTGFIVLNTRECSACGDCVDECVKGVLALRGPFFHRHIHIVRGQECTGCLKCMKACKNNVFKKRENINSVN